MDTPFEPPVALLDNPSPVLVVSSCLTGEAVRYDGTDKYLPRVLPLLARYLKILPVCPEMAAGLGVPRPAVRWVRKESGDLQLRGVEQPQLRVDRELAHASADWCQHNAPATCALLKARSPSCGSGTTPIHDPQGQPLELADGLFAAELKRRHRVCVIDENYFQAPLDPAWLILGCYLQAYANPLLAGKLLWEEDLEEFLYRPLSLRIQQWHNLTA